ncbi:HNH endonuclease signature motif containing protein [Butyrivibrio sp. AC2005]|uniref:HNH endonuclease signature motif containing protein n=1 Tax=Butyrivibrio sp. AC2005 TaxID=1280672 RepID=UPI0004021384|nr:HNH endonuclease [Butyrivibrio sp. AC2005]
MSEIPVNELKETFKIETENYKDIKPEGESIPDEARKALDDFFKQGNDAGETDAIVNPHEEIQDGKKFYYDDNGTLYRVNDELAPNAEYELDGQKYITDERGRIISDKDITHDKMGNKLDMNNGLNEDLPRTPFSNGEWEGERGNSIWHPDREYVPPEKSKEGTKPYSNPENKTWGELLDKYGIDGIEFKNGFPDFSDISRGTVEIEGFETGGNAEKNRNFNKAYVALAEQRGCSPYDVKAWMSANNYTWHECENKQTMQKVPNEIHANIPHDGGRSQE